MFHSTVLGLDVYVDRGEIRFRDPGTARKLLTLEETELTLEETELALKEARARIAELEGKPPAGPYPPPRPR